MSRHQNTFADFTVAPAGSQVDTAVVDVLETQIEPIANIKVPSVFPTLTNFPYRIAIVGDYPCKDSQYFQVPFSGQGGKLLNGIISRVGIVREACFLGYIHEGLDAELDTFKPNITILLGKHSLQTYKAVKSLDDYRGSLFIGITGRKMLATFSPADCWKMYDRTGYMMFDFAKALRHALTPDLVLPQRTLEVTLSYEELLTRLNALNLHPCTISVDIEGYWNNLSCCSIARSTSESFIVPFANLDSSSYWTEEQEIEIWRAFTSVIANPAIPKVWQNGLYDRFVLQYGFGITVRGNVDDTMLKWHEKWCELEKGLGVQASVLTDEPYWKFERKSDTKEAYYSYCCKDSAVTYELNTKLETKLDDRQKAHYRHNHALLNPILYMELKGIRYDTEKAKERRAEINTALYTYQAQLDALANVGVTHQTTKQDLAKRVAETCCYKKDGTTFKAAFAEHEHRLRTIIKKDTNLTTREIGYINMACKWSMNTKSDQFKKFLYGTLNLPKQYDPKTKELTTDYEALLRISKKSPHEAVSIALELGELRTRSQLLAISADEDGRVRCGYNIVGTETCRITCYTSPTGSGYNLQTMPDANALKPENHPLRGGLRDLFLADEGYYMFQCDLSGADGWTVGAHLAALGDPTMLDDLLYGIKPAQRICYMLRHGHGSLLGKPRDEVKHLLKEIEKESWDYFACKGGIWGTCYTMGPKKLSEHIFVQSEGKVNFSLADATEFQRAVFTVYNVHLWHRHTERVLKRKPELVSPNGHRRRFFGRSTEILGQALAHEPQVNTTAATNMAAYKLWIDNDNRITTLEPNKRCQLRIQPLHQVHDALIVQCKKQDTAWCIEKLKTYFNNPMLIAGIPITIPFGGSYGPSWGEQTFSIK